MIHIAILQDSHSHLEREIQSALFRAEMQSQIFLWHETIENLADFDGFILIGCDSHEKNTSIANQTMQVIKEQSALGKPILGICKGANILVETGLVPGLEWNQVGMTLAENKNTLPDNAKVRLRLSERYHWNAFTRCLMPKAIFQLPLAHTKDCFVISPVLLAEIERNGLHVFQYCDEHGMITNEFPINPNGYIHHIAAISNKSGNVMAMLPHPELTAQGDAIFKSMCEYITAGSVAKPLTLNYQPR